jgi:hypothetical protein
MSEHSKQQLSQVEEPTIQFYRDQKTWAFMLCFSKPRMFKVDGELYYTKDWDHHIFINYNSPLLDKAGVTPNTPITKARRLVRKFLRKHEIKCQEEKNCKNCQFSGHNPVQEICTECVRSNGDYWKPKQETTPQ